MPRVPVTFLLSFALALLLLWLATGYGRKIGWLPKLTLGLLSVQSVLIGLRWTYDYRDALLFQATLATLTPPLVLLSMRQMASTEAAREPIERILLYCIPALIVLVSPVLEFAYVDWIIEAVVVGFGAALLYLGLATDVEWRDKVSFGGVLEANLAFVVAGSALLFSAAVDLAVNHDLVQTGGRLAPQIVGISNLVLLLCLSAGVLLLHRRTDKDAVSTEAAEVRLVNRLPPGEVGDEDMAGELATLIKRIDAEIIERKFYRDPNLSLDRLSRRLSISARQISLAVNSQRAINVSQYINLFRVTEAAHLLKTGKSSITELIYEVGFNTKSNFNREFKRMVGVSPSEWRKGTRDLPRSPMDKFREEIGEDVVWEPVQAPTDDT